MTVQDSQDERLTLTILGAKTAYFGTENCFAEAGNMFITLIH